MEPMALGSPSGSPAGNTYLPAFLMGETQMTTPRNNTLSPLSPNKATGRNVSFANSPTATSPQDYNYNRSALGQKTLFGGYQQTPPSAATPSGIGANYPGTPLQNHNTSQAGPPTQGLFDSLRSERNQVQTPTRNTLPSQSFGTPLAGAQQNVSLYGMHQQSYQHQQSYNDSYLDNSSFNASAVQRGIKSPMIATPSYMLQCPPTPRYTDFWVTVYGFPPSGASTILQHFAQCGTIVEKVFPSQNGNWVHLKFSSRLESDKAINYNEKILGNNIMIGVTQCKDRSIIDKESLNDLSNAVQPTPKVRPLAQTAYRSAQADTAVVASPSAPQKSTGLMNKAMDLFFGW